MAIRLLWFLVVALGGAGLTIQMAWNARLRSSTGSAVLATLISVFVSLVSLILLWVSGAAERGSLPAFNSVPKWAWFGGVLPVFYLVASLVAMSKFGAATVFSLVFTGQMIAALILDSTGVFGVPVLPVSPARLLGAVLLLAGVILIQKR